MSEERVVCRTPSVGRVGTTRIPKWKFDAVREAVLQVPADGEVPFSELTERTGGRLAEDDWARLGSIGWRLTTPDFDIFLDSQLFLRVSAHFLALHFAAFGSLNRSGRAFGTAGVPRSCRCDPCRAAFSKGSRSAGPVACCA